MIVMTKESGSGKKCQYLKKKKTNGGDQMSFIKKTEQTKFEVTIWGAYAGKVWELRPQSKEI